LQQTTIEPNQVYTKTVTMHAAFTGAVVIYVMVGEVIKWSDPEFDGYVFSGGDDTMWFLRGLFVVVGSLQALLGLVLRRMVAREMLQEEHVDASKVASRLQADQISRDASSEAVAIFGLILYLLGGQRADLYGFCAVSMVGLLLTWPRRAVWEATFRELAVRHPNVPSDPWRQEPST
jgi:hypothetical protein